MRAPQHSSAYDELYAGDRFVHDDLLPGERIGPPRARGGLRTLFRRLVFLLAAFGAGWALLGPDPAAWPGRIEWMTTQVSTLMAALERKATATPVERVTSALVPSGAKAGMDNPIAFDRPLPPTPPPPARMDPLPVAPPAPPLTTASLAPAATDKLPPPTVDPADPYQVRAEAVGLHPGLSRVLLSRLSDADYRNAGVAIKTAVAETADGGVYVWPRQRKPELAVFKVHFVPGAAPDCRRYVVAITKDGWMTTAPPMERCGAQAGNRPRRG